MLTLIAARHAIDAAMPAADIVERQIAHFALGDLQDLVHHLLDISEPTPPGAPLTAMVRLPNGSVSKPLAFISSAIAHTGAAARR